MLINCPEASQILVPTKSILFPKDVNYFLAPALIKFCFLVLTHFLRDAPSFLLRVTTLNLSKSVRASLLCCLANLFAFSVPAHFSVNLNSSTSFLNQFEPTSECRVSGF